MGRFGIYMSFATQPTEPLYYYIVFVCFFSPKKTALLFINISTGASNTYNKLAESALMSAAGSH